MKRSLKRVGKAKQESNSLLLAIEEFWSCYFFNHLQQFPCFQNERMISYPEPFPFLAALWGTRRSPATVTGWIGLETGVELPLPSCACPPDSRSPRNCCSRTSTLLKHSEYQLRNQMISLACNVALKKDRLCIYTCVQSVTEIHVKGELAFIFCHWGEKKKELPGPAGVRRGIAAMGKALRLQREGYRYGLGAGKGQGACTLWGNLPICCGQTGKNSC